MSSSPLPPPPPPSSTSTTPTQERWPCGVANGIRILSIIAAVVWGLFGVAILNRISVLREIKNDTFGNDIVQRANDADDYAQMTAGLGFCLGIAVVILLMIWLFRTTKLVRSRGFTTRYKPGWAIGGVFIPIAQFVIIYQMLADCRRALPHFDSEIRDTQYTTLPWWWGLQTAAIIAGRALSSSETTEVDSLLNEEYLRLGMAAAMVAASVLAALTFGRFRQDYRRIEFF